MDDELGKIAKITESLSKLGDTLKAGFGLNTGARRIKKQSEAAIVALKTFNTAVQESEGLEGALFEIKDGEIRMKALSRPIEERIQIRESANLARKELNFQNVVVESASELLNNPEEPLSEEPVNSDWTTRFISIVEDISNEEMQIWWAKVLAGEVRNPGSYSLRTLELLKNISHEEALLFNKAARLIFNGRFISSDEHVLKEFEITYDDILKLEEAGLLKRSSYFQPNENGIRKGRLEISYRSTFAVNIKDSNRFPRMPVLILTTSGVEIASLVKERKYRRYYQILREFYEHQGYQPMDYSSSFGVYVPWAEDSEVEMEVDYQSFKL